MLFEDLEPAVLVRRYKRFLADVRREDGSELTVHCPNTGAMTGCAEPGFRVWIAPGNNPKRKYSHSWLLSQNRAGHFICVQSARANALVAEALAAEAIPELAGYEQLRREAVFGEEGSRADFLLSGTQGRCLLEVKSVTLLLGDGLGAFPDAVSARGRKHLRELISVRRAGDRAVLLFCALHTGIQRVAPADAVDAAYGDTLREAIQAGVEVLAYGARIDDSGMVLGSALPLLRHQPD